MSERDKMIERAKVVICNGGPNSLPELVTIMAELMADFALQEIEKADPWILVEERLPEKPQGETDSFNVTYRSERASGPIVVIARFARGQFWWADGSGQPIDRDYRKVIAWKPLPKPYKG